MKRAIGTETRSREATFGQEPDDRVLPRNRLTFALTAIVAVAFALRFFLFSTQELGLDGHLAVGLAAIPIPDMLAFNLRDVHPPLFYLALRQWLAVAGTTFVAAKWLTVASAVLTVPLIFQIARRASGRRSGLLAALLLAVSPAHIFQSPTVRDFAPGLLLSLSSTLVLICLTASEKDGEWRRSMLAVALALSTGAALLTWYFHAIYLPIQAGLLIIKRPKGWRLSGCAILAGTLAAAPWLAYALTPLLAKATGTVGLAAGAARLLDAWAFGREMTASLAGATPFPWPIPLGLWLAFLGLGLIRGFGQPGRRAWAAFCLAGLAISLIVVYLMASLWVQGTFFSRYTLILLPFAIFAQVLLVSDPAGTMRAIASLGLAVLLIPAAYWYVDFSRMPAIPYESDQVELFLEQRVADGDAIVFTDIARLGFYRLRESKPAPSYAIHFAGADFLRDEVEARAGRLLPELNNHKQVWLVNTAADNGELSAIMKDTLGRSLAEETVLNDEGADLEIVRYRTPSSLLNPFAFGDAIKLVGYRVSGDGAALAGETLTVDVFWTATAAVGNDYTVSLQLLDQKGRLVVQADGPPAGGRAPSSAWLPGEQIVDTRSIRLGNEAGAFALGVAMYELPSLRRLAVAGSAENLAVLGTIEVK